MATEPIRQPTEITRRIAVMLEGRYDVSVARVKEVAAELSITPRTVYNHLRYLREHGLPEAIVPTSSMPSVKADGDKLDCAECVHEPVCRFKESYAKNRECAACRFRMAKGSIAS